MLSVPDGATTGLPNRPLSGTAAEPAVVLAPKPCASARPWADDGWWPLAGLAGIWLIGGLGSGPLHLGRISFRGQLRRPVLTPIAIGLAAGAVFVLGALVVREISPLRAYTEHVLAHARQGSLVLVAVVTLLNGVAEETFFRGALFAALGDRRPVLASTGIYAVVTVATGNPMLVFAAVVIRKFGPRYFICGMVGFMGYFFALFLNARAHQLRTRRGHATACLPPQSLLHNEGASGALQLVSLRVFASTHVTLAIVRQKYACAPKPRTSQQPRHPEYPNPTIPCPRSVRTMASACLHAITTGVQKTSVTGQETQNQQL